MRERILVLLLLVFNYLAKGETADEDLVTLKSLMDTLKKTPPNWEGSDPCDAWDGIKCENSRVTSITLSSMGLEGELSGDIGSLSELETLDLSYNKDLTGSLPRAIGELRKLSTLILVGCSFNGPIPDEIGFLQELRFISLNSNSFTGRIPHSIGNLSNLYWLDLADNELQGPIPISSGSVPGLDKLHHAKHFHLGKNNLSGNIPPQLFSSEMALIHLLLESNNLIGKIPSTLGLAKNLEVLRLDGNSLSGPVPSNINNLTNVQELYLSNNKLSGTLPSLSDMSALNYLDLSNNTFEPLDFPSWILTLTSLTTLNMENTQLQGEIPDSLFSLVSLQTVVLKDNKINGTLNVGSTYSKHLQLIDLENNAIDNFEQKHDHLSVRIILKGNPVCYETVEGIATPYCSDNQANQLSYRTPWNNCQPSTCSLGQVASPNCECAYPYTGTLTFRAPSFSDLGNKSYFQQLEKGLMQSFESHHLPVDSVLLSHPTEDPDHYLELSLQVFPAGQDRFNRTGVYTIGFLLSNQTFKPPKVFGPFYFDADKYEHFGNSGTMESSKSVNIGIIAGAAVGGCVLVVLLVVAGVYAFCQKKRAERAIGQSNPFRRWDTAESKGDMPQLKEARRFSFEELKRYTRNFSQANDIGSGGYGKVYKGTLPNGQLLAIKRAQRESKQGRLEFKAEIELLSRVHHKNLVTLIGFCFEHEEQMLVYEFVPNGTLKDTLTGKSGIRLDWVRRLKVALGAAQGLTYLHELADPPIIHRDIKSNNVLLDECLNAKVGDFGLSKSIVDPEKDHVTTQVKGTMGYLDPEYYMSQQLTEKSDVYSFGVLMLEIISARRPIERGKYIVKEVRNAMDMTKVLCGLHEIIDPSIGLGASSNIGLVGLDKFVDLAMKCVSDSGVERPKMSEVVRELENILHHSLAAGGSNDESGSMISSSYEEVSRGSSSCHPYSSESFDLKAALSYPKVEPK
ncbi:leucine-rich repeat receptor protein kinase HPCA1-like [Arachis stenosperma]|uniref:leucine-rich repeat receptor protein kinase HPCA1-like n=1 Tax=Arachis stenosperma TaxID=217475 RepID=UPI0025AC097E|nr:leucine-rich repeat receptor protein kinase HPCA1-like [Arachis stenosperma]